MVNIKDLLFCRTNSAISSSCFITSLSGIISSGLHHCSIKMAPAIVKKMVNRLIMKKHPVLLINAEHHFPI